jgi:hypothetical protein
VTHAHLVELESELLTVACRASRSRLEALLHRDFEEIGASATFWTRQVTIENLVSNPNTIEHPELTDVLVRDIDTNAVLVTYVLTTANRPPSRRSSLWLLTNDTWQLRFHQGTPLP